MSKGATSRVTQNSSVNILASNGDNLGCCLECGQHRVECDITFAATVDGALAISYTYRAR